MSFCVIDHEPRIAHACYGVSECSTSLLSGVLLMIMSIIRLVDGKLGSVCGQGLPKNTDLHLKTLKGLVSPVLVGACRLRRRGFPRLARFSRQ